MKNLRRALFVIGYVGVGLSLAIAYLVVSLIDDARASLAEKE